jgi:hypothetical protein
MKKAQFAVATAVFAFLAFLIGCGGGGGGGSSSGSGSNTSSTTTGSTTGVTNVSLYALYSGTQSPASILDTGSSKTALALSVGDLIQFSYIGEVTTSSGQSHQTVSGGTVSTTAPSSVAYVSGSVLHVVGTSGSKAYAVTGSYQGQSYTYTFTSTAAQAKVSGYARDTNGLAISGAPVLFFKGTTLVGKTTTGFDGTFIGSVPATATGFSLDLSGFKGVYYDEYSYLGLNYTAAVSGCATGLPKLKTGTTASLPGQVIGYAFEITNPPPAPSGCG